MVKDIKKPVFSNRLQEWMAKPIHHSQFFYLDKWTFVHFASGLILGALFARYYLIEYAWLIALALLVVYEFFERAISDWLFRKELLLDKIWDLIIGMAGFFLAFYWFF